MTDVMPLVIATFFYTLVGSLIACVAGLVGLAITYATAFVVCV